MKHLFCFGYGYTAQALTARLDRSEWKVSGTNRASFETLQHLPADVTHVLSSVPPGPDGDPVVNKFATDLARGFTWVGYLSTTGVYGDHAGAEVDENTPLQPVSDRGARRVAAEKQWAHFNTHIFRLPGIYGPGRSQLDALREGTAKRIIKPGQLFSRIHVDDIAGVLHASLNTPNPSRAYNVADDEPCPPQDVVTYAAKLLGVAPPPEIDFEHANLSPMARSFYGESKRVSNARMKQELGYKLKYPNYRDGLEAILKSERAQ
ncbi:SDR family oxidoreductase [Aestuariivirga litoralis]|uniref:SDR family oxidoreductase n=1 Tax=Aestuariivirga litoralis TaxID=2650924 RepID=UPI0018C50D52|nr:SDR family oxidoreductase [Aestuariivirga litoralis]MBG1232937.1 SDR family oxidoreductase [Aestuariivirga litoralis]